MKPIPISGIGIGMKPILIPGISIGMKPIPGIVIGMKAILILGIRGTPTQSGSYHNGISGFTGALDPWVSTGTQVDP